MIAAGLFAVSAAAIGLTWAWLGAPVAMPPSPLAAGDKIDCISYTPYQAADSPFEEGGSAIAPGLIAADVGRLAPLTKCLRTYSAADHGIAEVVPQAARQGLSVMQGIWISRDAAANEREINAAVAIAKANPKTVTALIVGNEVLLRQEQTAAALVELIKKTKALSGLPVTYADVWEFWLANPSVAEAVDFITIHILPFWEDDPVVATDAARHVGGIYARMAQAYPGKRIIIGEVGWPSAGRMREAALPSPANQARVLHDVLALTRAKGITANIIEAFDQPWKRQLEGTVGGHWGVFDADVRTSKFAWGEAVSNHPCWRLQAAGGVGLAALVLLLGAIVARRRPASRPPISGSDWARIALVTTVSATLAGLSIESLQAGAFGTAGITRALILGLVALTAPFVAVAIAGGARLPSFAQTIGPAELRARCPLSRAAGFAFIAVFVAAAHVALSLTFNPRYWEFPFAPLGAAALAFLALQCNAPADERPDTLLAEKLGAAMLLLTAVFIVFNEGLQNWQALALAASLAAIAFTMLRAPGVQTPSQ